MRFATVAARAAYVLALPVLLITSNIRFIAGDVSFYERGFREHDAEQATGIALPDLDRAAGEIVDYFEDDANELRVVVTESNREVSLFNAEETAHMKDVKALIRVVFRVNEISLAVVLAYVGGVVLWSRERSLRGLALDSLLGVGAGLVAVTAVGVLALVGFDEFWNNFHEVLFPGGGWQFDPDTDRLIQMFPEPFWQDMVTTIGLLTAAEVLVLVFASLALLLGTRGERKAPRPIPAIRNEGVHQP